MTASTGGSPTSEPLDRAKEQKAWYWYDWANSRLLHDDPHGPLRAVHDHGRRPRGRLRDDADDTCDKTVNVLGLHLAAGSLPFYLTSFATILSAFVLPVVGAIVDRSPRKKLHMAGFAWAGAVLRRPALLHEGRQLADRCGRDRRQQHPGRLLAGQLLRDPGRHRDRGRARPGLVPGLGVRLPRRRAAAARSTW